MNILILSCDTGGGHNTAGLAVLEELRRRGHHAELIDPFHLSQNRIAQNVGSCYVKLVQRRPRLFGFAYRLGMIVTKLPFKSPVYYANKRMSDLMASCFAQHPADVLAAPHLFPAEILTSMKKKGIPCPKSIFIATDYACIPFTEETDCDYYVIPHRTLIKNFARRGIPLSKIKPLGIPVRSSFTAALSKKQAREKLGLSPNLTYDLVAGGSMGAGKVKKLVKYLVLSRRAQEHIIVICGKNDSLKHALSRRFGTAPGITILGFTSEMALYMRACDLLYSKPGGLSSTEAAVTGIPLIHTTPIPGCETANRAFFRRNGMSISAKSTIHQAVLGQRLRKHPQKAEQMIENQKKHISKDAASRICDLIETMGPHSAS